MAQTNPLVAQGTLNRLRGSVVIPGFPELNVTAPFLGEAGIGLQLEGVTTTFINSMTGAVSSPEPYQILTCTIALLRTQGLAELYKAKIEGDARIGDFTVRVDASTLSQYPAVNGAIESLAPLQINGRDAGFGITLKGYYNINNDLWQE